MTKIADLIKTLANNGDEVYNVPGEVVSVNSEARTCVVDPYNGSARIYNVRIQAIESGTVGVFPSPKIGSSVVVGFLSKNFAFVALASELEEIKIDVQSIVINGGENKGLVRISDMVASFNELITQVNQMRTYISTHSHPAHNSPPSLPQAYGPLQSKNISNFENPKVKH